MSPYPFSTIDTKDEKTSLVTSVVSKKPTVPLKEYTSKNRRLVLLFKCEVELVFTVDTIL